MIDVEHAAALLVEGGMAEWAARLPVQLYELLEGRPHGDMQRWRKAIDRMPLPVTRHLYLDRARIQVGEGPDSTPEQRDALRESLQVLHPWRKGPYLLHGVSVETEWRSDWKWDRLSPHIAPLDGRRVLDVGCGNGYHCWRMLGAGAQMVVGIDPTMLFFAQFQALARLFGAADTPLRIERVLHLPLGIEGVPPALAAFDSVFSMGVLYHRRAPVDHLVELRDTLRPGGELVLETLIVEGDERTVLLPSGRYAKMRNVWFIPSVAALELWLRRAGFTDIRTVDVTPTTSQEQRSTEWMRFESLSDFLDPADSSFTIEGYPAPRRAIVLANRP
jgi:tRNA (mo5U34)-methyltransferase